MSSKPIVAFCPPPKKSRRKLFIYYSDFGVPHVISDFSIEKTDIKRLILQKYFQLFWAPRVLYTRGFGNWVSFTD